MAITLKQFDGSTVTPTDDAIINQLIIGASGIIEGCVPTWLGSNQIKVSAGRGIAMGRQFTVDEQTVTVTLTGGSKGRLLINIDIGNATPGSFVSQAASTLPGLTQQDINHGGTIFQVPICTYDVGALAISNMVDVRSLLVGPTVINHSADKITSGTLPLTRGGTGAVTAAAALSNIGAAAADHTHAFSDDIGSSALTAVTSSYISSVSRRAYMMNKVLIVTGSLVVASAISYAADTIKIATLNSGYLNKASLYVVGIGFGLQRFKPAIVFLSGNDLYVAVPEGYTIQQGDNIRFSISIPMA